MVVHIDPKFYEWNWWKYIKCIVCYKNGQKHVGFYSLVHCHLVYCIEAWSCGNAAAFKTLYLKQNKAIRFKLQHLIIIVTLIQFKKKLKLCLYQLADFFKLQFMFKFSKQLLPSSFVNLWLYNRQTRNEDTYLRNENDFMFRWLG